jgi:hypothetical protein
MKYTGLTIPDKVTIVSNTRKQGYLVNNETQLASARFWAGKDYVEKSYTNGTFKLKLLESAENSYRGGKLSFWNCEITAEDGVTFILGISSDELIKLLKSNTFVKGELQGKVYLGRHKSRVAAYTKDMEELQQAKKDSNIRETKPTTKYNVGDIVYSLRDGSYIYYGEFATRYDVYSRWLVNDDVICINTCPSAHNHLYISENLSWMYTNDKKQSRRIEGHSNIDLETIKESYCKQSAKYTAAWWSAITLKDLLLLENDINLSEESVLAIVDKAREKGWIGVDFPIYLNGKRVR